MKRCWSPSTAVDQFALKESGSLEPNQEFLAVFTGLPSQPGISKPQLEARFSYDVQS